MNKIEKVQPNGLTTLSEDKIELIKKTVAEGATDLELEMFMHQANRTGLDPLSKQIYFVKRGSGKNAKGTIQVGIDGLRLLADRTGNYMPGSEEFEYQKPSDKYPFRANVSVFKRVGVDWREVKVSARWSEYAASYNGQIANMWAKFPETMLAKCAEAKALRKCFPAELSGLYTTEEMSQADNPQTPAQKTPPPARVVEGSPARRSERKAQANKAATPAKEATPEEKSELMGKINDLLGQIAAEHDQDLTIRENALEMISEFVNDKGELVVKGVGDPSMLSYNIKEGKKMSQAQVVYGKLKEAAKLDPEDFEAVLKAWRKEQDIPL